MINEINRQITKKANRARVFIRAHDTRLDKLSSSVKFLSVSYLSYMASFAN